MVEKKHAELNLEGSSQVELDPEQIRANQRAKERHLGASVLSGAGFQERQAQIVDSSLAKEMARGETLSGKNGERRNLAYLTRLERMIDRYGTELERKLWDASVEKLIIAPEDIEEDYWKTQEQILRDEGRGRTISDEEKAVYAREVQRQQRESLRDWANYLGDEDAPYPLWFKVYAWDGMSKMGVFDKEKGEFKKRNKHTVAPYPRLNEAVLAKVYEAVVDFYKYKNTKDKTAGKTDAEERDKRLDALVQSGNFNKIYSKFLLEQKVLPKTSERTEDVQGEWVEYLLGQEEELAIAAEGTPWCVAVSTVGRGYLNYGRYVADDGDAGWDNDYDDEYYEDDDQWQNGAKFILFHLKDPETQVLADSACASIRLGCDGKVAEISGLNKGQALEDSLVPIVEEKVKSLPGGQHFLDAFRDKKKLIALDRKMSAGEELTAEDVSFIFEREGKIHRLNTYAIDPRMNELRYKALNQGADLSKKDLIKLAKDYGRENGGAFSIYHSLRERGLSDAEIFCDLDVQAESIAQSLDLAKVYDVDLRVVAKEFLVGEILKEAASLEKNGFSVAELINEAKVNYLYDRKLPIEDIRRYVEQGASLDRIISALTPHYALSLIPELMKLGMSHETLKGLASYRVLYLPDKSFVRDTYRDRERYYKEVAKTTSVLASMYINGLSLDEIVDGYTRDRQGQNVFSREWDENDEEDQIVRERQLKDYNRRVLEMNNFLRNEKFTLELDIKDQGGEVTEEFKSWMNDYSYLTNLEV